MTPLAFLKELWETKPEDQFVLIWTYPDRRSRWFTRIADAAAFVNSVNGSQDVYVGVGLAPKDYGPTARCPSNEISGVTGMWSDLDLHSSAHSKKALPGTVEQALTILPVAMRPTIIIATGNGLHCWWLLKKPYLFDDEEDRRRVMQLVKRWHTMLQLNAATHGWAYERLSDLARVLRIPSTHNLKDPKQPKEVVAHSFTDRRYDLCDFDEFLDNAGIPDAEADERGAREWTERFADKPLVINTTARIPEEKLKSWMDADLRFRKTWLRQRDDLKDQSNSGYDMALACFGVNAGLSDQEIVDLITHHRVLHGRAPRTRLDYFYRTIAKARTKTAGADGSSGSAVALSGVSSTPGEGLEEPGATEQPASDEVKAAILCADISQRIGVTILRLVRLMGKDPTFHMHLEHGIVEFTSVDKLINYASFRCAIAAKTKVLIRKFKPREWEVISQMLLKACVDEECTEEEEFEGSARTNILDYLSETTFIVSIDGQRIQERRKPMVADGRITVCSSDFLAYLNKTKSMNLTIKSAASMFLAVGAKKTDRFRNTRVNRQTRWELPFPEFDVAEIKPGAVGDQNE